MAERYGTSLEDNEDVAEFLVIAVEPPGTDQKAPNSPKNGEMYDM